MPHADDIRLAELAFQRGWITRAQLEQAQAGQKLDGRPLGIILYNLGILSIEQLADLAADPTVPVRTFERFRSIQLIGTGGAGSVYLAEDLQLKRGVAVKVLHSADPASLLRFRREAMLSASLEHPNIVKIYASGESDGQAYIAMQYVKGSSLRPKSMDRARILSVVQKIAHALHYAHSKGILHRDVKPENILMDSNGEVYLTDFGLARSIDGERLSVTGSILGTPVYMSPEQARGNLKAMDARSDVYSLGVTLYELLTGKVPFDGDGAYEVIDKIMIGTFTNPRKLEPNIPKEVETIILKAMSPEPHRRYASARDFADDVGRFLAGEPIQARRTGVGYRVARFVKRRQPVVGLGALVVLSMAIIAGILIPRLKEEQKRAEEAERLAEETRQDASAAIRSLAVSAYDSILSARRKGESVIDLQQEVSESLKKAYDRVAQVSPGLAEPDYLMGKIERARMRTAEALAYQEKALAKNPDYAPALYEHLILLSRRYALERLQAKTRLVTERLKSVARNGIESEAVKGIPEPTWEEIEKAFPALQALRGRIEKHCARLESALGNERPNDVRLSDAALLSARGIVAANMGRTDEAKTLLEQAAGKDPTLVEVYETLADLASSSNEKERWYTEGLRHDAGYVGFLLGRGNARAQRASDLHYTGRNSLPDFRLSEQDFSRAIELDAGCIDAMAARARVRSEMAQQAAGRGENPLPLMNQAEEDCTRALELDPKLDEAWIWRAAVRTNRGNYNEKMGTSPLSDYEGAISDFTHAIELDSDRSETWARRGGTRLNVATMLKGPERLNMFQKAEEDLTQSIARDKNHVQAWVWRGYVRYGKGRDRVEAGQDPGDDFRLAEEDLTHALGLNSNHNEARLRRASLYLFQGTSGISQGKDPSDFYRRAELDLESLFAFNPKSIDAVRSLTEIYMNRAALLVQQNRNPTDMFAKAADWCTKGRALNPSDSTLWFYSGMIDLNLAIYRRRTGQDSMDLLKDASTKFGKAVELKPDFFDSYFRKGQAELLEGQVLAQNGEDPETAFRKAESDLSHAVQLRPGILGVHRMRAQVFIDRATHRASLKSDPLPDYQRALAEYTRLIEMDSKRPNEWEARAEIHWRIGNYLERQAKQSEAADAYSKAVADWEEVLRLNPRASDRVQPLLKQARKKANPEH